MYCALANEVVHEGATILHLGGGRDSLGVAQSLRGTNSRVFCVDVDLDGLGLNRNAIRVAGNGEVLPFADCSFDLILSDNVFEHLENPLLVLRECHRCLRLGGALAFMCPNRFGYIYLISSVTPHWLHAKFKKIAMRVDETDTFPTYYRLNSVKSINKIAQQAGFRLELIKSYVGWPTYWEFSDLLHRVFVVIHRALEILPPSTHITLVGILRRDS